ncbi:MAG: hypothetical protein AB1416_10840, partial [Actinomycetota bacterium]
IVSVTRGHTATRVAVALHDLTGGDARYRVTLDTGGGEPVTIGEDVDVGAGVRRGVAFRIPGGEEPLTGRLVVAPAGGGDPVAWAPFVALPPAPPPSGALGVPRIATQSGAVEATVVVGRHERDGDRLASVTLHGVAMWLVPAGGGDPLPVTGEKSRGDWPTGTYRFLVSRRLATGVEVPAGRYRLRVTASAPDGTSLRAESEPFPLR